MANQSLLGSGQSRRGAAQRSARHAQRRRSIDQQPGGRPQAAAGPVRRSRSAHEGAGGARRRKCGWAAAAAVRQRSRGAARRGSAMPRGADGDSSSRDADDKCRVPGGLRLAERQSIRSAPSRRSRSFWPRIRPASLADNAQYWLGEAYYVNKSYPEAQAAFQRVVDKYPQSRKRPDALLKIGYCQYELKQWDAGQRALCRRWPRSSPTHRPDIWRSSVSTRWPPSNID